MTTPWTAPTIRPLAAAHDAQSGGADVNVEDQFSNPSGQQV